MSVEIKEYPPAPVLCDFIDCYWHAVFPGSADQVNEIKILPSGFVDLVLHRSLPNFELVLGGHLFYSPRFLLGGFWTAPYTARFSDRIEVFSIRIKPEAMASLFQVPAAQFVNNPADLTDVFSDEFVAFCCRIKDAENLNACILMADSFFLQKACRVKHKNGHVHRASALIRKNGAISVGQLSDEVCISRRQLERQFKQSLGISPKMYIRISRMNRMLGLLKAEARTSLSQLSSAAGYFDQAHFIKDFRELAGEAPATFLGRSKNFSIRMNL
ncbi:MAG: helix-turn-helix domain-containing protein [Chryseosolibacter sp.]